MPNRIPDDIAEFVAANIEAVWQLDLLACLCRNRSKIWTAEELAASLYLDVDAVTQGLAHLKGCGVRAEGPGYRLEPESADQDRILVELIQTYSLRRVAVRQLIYTRVPNSPSSP